MAHLNQLNIIGNVGRDPNFKYTQSGVPVVDFSVATKKGRGDSQKTVWVKVTAWRGLAETVNKYVKKGMLIQVTGEVDVSAYNDKNSEPAASLELTADNIVFLSFVEGGERSTEPATGGYDNFSAPPDNSGDIPF